MMLARRVKVLMLRLSLQTTEARQAAPAAVLRFVQCMTDADVVISDFQRIVWQHEFAYRRVEYAQARNTACS